LANTAGEVVGLGLAAVAGMSLAWTVAKTLGGFTRIGLAGVMILMGTFEGLIVGIAQWLVLRRAIPDLDRQRWLMATAIGAFIAWTLGMIPSTLIHMRSDTGSSQPPAVSHALMYGLAVLMGAVLGPVLGVPQWLVLRRHLHRAGWWVWGNTAAWALGMPVVFIGASSVPPGGLGLTAVVIAVVSIGCAGALVGAVHGLVLICLLRSRQRRAVAT
jgi:hypothetical protein